MTNLNTPFMIGDVEIPNRTVLAPMAGVTNSAFRTIAKELGAGLVVMEMVSDKGIQYNNEKTLHMLHIDEGENPVSNSLEVTKIAWHAQLNLSKKIPRPISSISTWVAR